MSKKAVNKILIIVAIVLTVNLTLPVKALQLTPSANNYDQFYNIIKDNILNRTSVFKIYCRNYSSSTYRVDKAINQATKDSFNKNFNISSYKADYLSKGKSRDKTIIFNIAYRTVDGSARTYNDVLNIINSRLGSSPEKLVIKLMKNNFQVIHKLPEINKDINGSHSGSKSLSVINMDTLSFAGSGVMLINLQFGYKDSKPNSPAYNSFIIGSDDELFKALQLSINKIYAVINITFTDNYLGYNMNSIYNKIEQLTNMIQDKLTAPNYIAGIKTEISSRTSVFGGKTCSAVVNINYNLPRETILKHESDLNTKANTIIASIIKPGMSDFQKELAIHNYIVNNAKYDYENLKKNSIPAESYTAYGILVRGVGVCEGYSNAMNLLLNMAGVESRTIVGRAGGQNHAWNIVKLDDGNYYQVDVTWDDPITPRGNQVLSFKYFNITDEQMAKDHTWNTDLYPKCSGTKYSYTGK